MLKYKIDVLQALKEAGYSTYRIRKDKILPEGTLQSLRNYGSISFETLEKLCGLLGCQPSDILEYTPEEE